MKRNFIGSQSTKDLRYMKYLLIVRIFVALRYCGIPSHSVFCLSSFRSLLTSVSWKIFFHLRADILQNSLFS